MNSEFHFNSSGKKKSSRPRLSSRIRSGRAVYAAVTKELFAGGLATLLFWPKI